MKHSIADNKRSTRQDISVVIGVFVENEKSEILFVKMSKWGDHWGIPGGHLDSGEKLEVCALRELEEETGIKVDTAEYLGYVEMVNPKDFHENKHFVSFQFKVKVIGKPELKLEERELSDYRWMTLEDAMKQKDLNSLLSLSLEQIVKDKLVEANVDYKDKWLRAQADYSNLIKETTEKRSQWIMMSEWQILEEFIPVYDNFKKAFSGLPEDEDKKWENWAKGIEYIQKQFGDILKQYGIEDIDTVGKRFDPTMHECLNEEMSNEYDDGVIIREVNAGYKKGNKIFKVAGVVVCKK